MSAILLTGKSGQLGWELQRTLASLGNVVAFDSHELDLADTAALRETVRNVKPGLIVNAAAYTDVERAEQEPERAQAVNGTAPGILAEEGGRFGAWMIHYSTDYVFDGAKSGAYCETDLPNPLNVYGRSKLAGEEAVRAAGNRHLILRTSWLYGARGRNFMLAMLRLGREQDELKVVDDQVGAPTWSRSVAEITGQIVAQFQSPLNGEVGIEAVGGTYHVAAGGAVSWYGFAEEIFNQVAPELGRKMVAVASSESEMLAVRPKNSLLSNRKLGQAFGLYPERWQKGLELCLADMRA